MNKILELIKNKPILFIIILGISTFLLYARTIPYDFINYDDDYFIIKNSMIKEFSWDNTMYLLSLFKRNYSSLTLISFSIDYHFHGLNPAPYRLNNIILHVLNTILVFYLIKRLLFKKSFLIPAITVLLFAFHPFRIESVVWIAERKDMLMALFYLLGLHLYISYLKSNNNIKKYFYVILFLISACLSILSKFAGITLPIAILIIDYYYKRKITLKFILEKTIFLLPTIFFGLVYFYGTTLFPVEKKATVDASRVIAESTMGINYYNPYIFDFVDKIFLASYSFAFYIIGLFYPGDMSILHPYPIKENETLPTIYYLASIFVLIIIGLFIFLLKKDRNNFRKYMFGGLFFALNIGLVMHFVSFGGWVVVGERYTYIAYIGLFFIIAFIADKLINDSSKLMKHLSIIFLLGYSSFLLAKNITRQPTWENSLSMFKDVIEKEPEARPAYKNLALAQIRTQDFEGALKTCNLGLKKFPYEDGLYISRGVALNSLKKYKLAIQDYNTYLRLRPKDFEGYTNRGVVKVNLKDYQGAIEDFSKSIEINEKNNYYSYFNRGRIYLHLNKYEKAIEDFNIAAQQKPDDGLIYYNRANAKRKIKQIDEAITDYNKAIENKVFKAEAYFYRAMLNKEKGNKQIALTDLNTFLQAKPERLDAISERGKLLVELNQAQKGLDDINKVLLKDTGNIELQFAKGNALFLLKKFNEAEKAYEKVVSISPNDEAYSNLGNIKYMKKDFKSAISYYSTAIEINPKNPDYFFNRGISYYQLGKTENGCSDIKKASEMGHKQAEQTLKKYCK